MPHLSLLSTVCVALYNSHPPKSMPVANIRSVICLFWLPRSCSMAVALPSEPSEERATPDDRVGAQEPAAAGGWFTPGMPRRRAPCCTAHDHSSRRFDDIARRSGESGESVSGPGSAMNTTASVRSRLPQVVSELADQIHARHPVWRCGLDSDSGTGMRLRRRRYLAKFDLELRARRASEILACRSRHLDISTSELPTVDLVWCRERLNHLSLKGLSKALQNVRRSRSRYLAATQYPHVESNADQRSGFPDSARSISPVLPSHFLRR